MRKNRLLKFVVALFWGCVLSLNAQAFAITGTATDIADAVPGTDRWQLTYHLTGPLPEFYSVTLMFPTSTFGDITLMASPPASLDAVSTPPVDPLSDFLLTLTALTEVNSADYSIFFTRLGSLPFGAQSYEVADDSFGIFDSGRFTITVASQPNTVPEPSSGLLLGLGIAAAIACRRMRPRAS